MSIRNSDFQFASPSDESDSNSSAYHARRQRNSAAPARSIGFAQQAANRELEEELRDSEMKAIPVEEQEQMARRDAAMSSFEIRTLDTDSSFLFPSDLNGEIMEEVYEKTINPPLNGEVDDPEYCYLCRATNDRGTNQHVNKMDRLAEAVPRKSFETVIDDIYAYYDNTLRRTERRKLRKSTIRQHYLFHAPNMLWHAKLDLNRTTDMTELLMRAMVHVDLDGRNPRIVQEHYKLYRAIEMQKRGHLLTYFQRINKK